MSLLRKISITLFIALATLVFLPLGSVAAGSGTVTINITDEDEEGFSGDWYLHHGTTINGYLVRNGSSGETFDLDPGYYYLEIRNMPGDHPYYLLYSENPQYIDDGANASFSVQYFETEEQMLTASGNPPEPEPEPEGGEGYDVYDEHGCNSTQGYVWCARDEICVKYWSPACLVEEPEEEPEESSDETSESTSETVLAASPSVYVPTFETTPNPYVPTFETPPTNFNPEIPEEGDFDIAGLQLAQTGPSVALILIPSMLLGLAAIRKKD